MKGGKVIWRYRSSWDVEPVSVIVSVREVPLQLLEVCR